MKNMEPLTGLPTIEDRRDLQFLNLLTKAKSVPWHLLKVKVTEGRYLVLNMIHQIKDLQTRARNWGH